MRGCLYKRKTKRGLRKGEYSWSIILSLGRDPVTKKLRQRWVTFHGTRKQAEQKLAELVGEVHRGEFVEPTKVTVGEWLDEWLQKAIQPPRRAANTYRVYGNAVKNYLKPALGHLLLQGLTPLHVERYYANLKLASTSASVHCVVLTSALKAAVNAGLLRMNVAQRAMNKPRARVTDDMLNNVWTVDEARRFLEHARASTSTQYVALFALALDSGCRRNELLGLQWRDLRDRTLHVERQLMSGGRNAPTFALPKRGRVRTLDLSDETLALLMTHKREQAEVKMANRTAYTDNGLIFAQVWGSSNTRHAVLGAPLRWTSVNARLSALCKAADVRRVTMHGLRHTCATLLLAAGVPPHVVQRRLGHARVEMTLNLYAHVLPDMQADAAARLAALLHR